MLITLRVKLCPSEEQEALMEEACARSAEAANWLAAQTRKLKMRARFALSNMFYYEIREKFGLPANMTQNVIRRVSGCRKANAHARHEFRADGGISVHKADHRWLGDKGVLAIRLIHGRISVPFVIGSYQKKYWHLTRKEGQLVRLKSGWYFNVAVELNEPEAVLQKENLGVDLGIINIAANSDGKEWSGNPLEVKRFGLWRRRAHLQRIGEKQKVSGKRPKAIRRKLRELSGRVGKLYKEVNHVISKRLVGLCQGTNRNIVLEDLSGKLSGEESVRVSGERFRKPVRQRISGWSFYQIRNMIEYKARMVGVSVILVNPRGTSRTCSKCGHMEDRNRRSRDVFKCKKCGNTMKADINAAKNIALRGYQCSSLEVPEKLTHNQTVMGQFSTGTKSCQVEANSK